MFTNHQVEIEAIAEVEQVDFSALPNRAKQESIFSSLIVLIPVAIAASVALFFIAKFPISWLSASIGGFILVTILLLWLGVKGVQKTGYALREQDFVLKQGVIWRTLTVVPFNRIQHIEIHRGPIERKLKLATLKLYTAGGSGVDLELNGLEQDTAESLKSYMLERISSEKQHDAE